ncbi:hypothetical protein C8Q77DRAFT_1073626 [Trametes polyzona]|nr:hypothetical protein C8Q77DRAFT_1073626 [Trametes polyzona]
MSKAVMDQTSWRKDESDQGRSRRISRAHLYTAEDNTSTSIGSTCKWDEGSAQMSSVTPSTYVLTDVPWLILMNDCHVGSHRKATQSESEGSQSLDPYAEAVRKVKEIDRESWTSHIETSGPTASPPDTHSLKRISDKPPSPNRAMLTKLKEVCKRITHLEERERQHQREIEGLLAEVTQLKMQHTGDIAPSSLERLNNVEVEIRRIRVELGTVQGGEQTQEELYEMYESVA